jgi:IS5 family transposase
VHPQEALLQAARAFQQTPAGRQRLRERVGVEHRLARLGQLGIGQARYGGLQKTRFQLLLAATVANLRRTWNWSAAVLPAC